MGIKIWQYIIAVLSAVFASTGFWSFLQKKSKTESDAEKMLLGLAHDRLVYLALQYIDRKRITEYEHENLIKYLYEPYKALGGNGTVTRLIDEINRLPITPTTHYKEEIK